MLTLTLVFENKLFFIKKSSHAGRATTNGGATISSRITSTWLVSVARYLTTRAHMASTVYINKTRESLSLSLSFFVSQAYLITCILTMKGGK